MNVLKKLQGQPEHRKMIMLWGMVIVLTVILGAWFIKRFDQRFRDFSQKEFVEQFKAPDFG